MSYLNKKKGAIIHADWEENQYILNTSFFLKQMADLDQ